MSEAHKINLAVGKFGSAIGRGLIAGLAGTAVITLSQKIEREITNRPQSFAPADAAAKALSIEASNREGWEKFSKEVHWTYGTLWGTARGLISMFGLKGWKASAIHFAAIYYAALHIEPNFEVAPPINEWSKKEIAIFALHHAVYVVITGLVFDAINKNQQGMK